MNKMTNKQELITKSMELPKCIRCFCDLFDDFQLIFDDTGLELELQKLLSVCFDMDIKVRLGEIQALCEDCLNELIDTYDVIQKNEQEGAGPSGNPIPSPKFKKENDPPGQSSGSDDFESFFDEEIAQKSSRKRNIKDEKNIKVKEFNNLKEKHARKSKAVKRDSRNTETLEFVVEDENSSEEIKMTNESYDVNEFDDENSNLDTTEKDSNDYEEFNQIDYLDDFDEEIDFNEYKGRVIQSKFSDVCFPEEIKCRLCETGVKTHIDLMRHTVEMHCVEEFAYPCIVDMGCESVSSQEHLTLHLVFKHYDLDSLAIYSKCPECERRFSDFSSFNKHSCYQSPGKLSRTKVDCDECRKVFTTNKRYRFHLQFHLEKRRPKACFICETLFRDEDEFFEHVMYNHEKNLDFVCIRCDRYYTSAETFKSHQESHKNERKYVCKLCPKTYIYKHFLSDHMITDHDAKSDFKCHICGKYWINKTYLKNHLQTHNKPKPTEVICCNECGFVAVDEGEAEAHLEEHGDKEVHTVTEILDRVYFCEYCELPYSSPNYLKEHRLLHTNKKFQCTICSSIFAEYKPFKLHKSLHPEYVNRKKTFAVAHYFVCDNSGCFKSFLQWATLKQHKKVHDNHLKCPKCKSVFEKSSDYEDHMQKVHQGHDFNCQFCDKTFGTRLALGVHISRKHTQEKFFCNQCAFSYSSEALLKNHQDAVHTDIPCEQCGIVLKNVRNYTLHQRVVHEREKRFFCKYCKKGFFKNCDVIAHEQSVHLKVKRFKCDLCPYEAVYKGSFTVHMRAHRNETPYECHLCGRGFRKNASLISHIKRHQNIRDFKCPIEGCEYAYVEKGNLNLHLRLKHPNGEPAPANQTRRFGITRSYFNVPKTDVFIDDDDGLNFGSDEEPPAKTMKRNTSEESDPDDPVAHVLKEQDSEPAVIVRRNTNDHDYIVHGNSYGSVMEDCQVAEVEVTSND